VSERGKINGSGFPARRGGRPLLFEEKKKSGRDGKEGPPNILKKQVESP